MHSRSRQTTYYDTSDLVVQLQRSAKKNSIIPGYNWFLKSMLSDTCASVFMTLERAISELSALVAAEEEHISKRVTVPSVQIVCKTAI